MTDLSKIFPEFEKDKDGNTVLNPDKVPPGFAYILAKNKKLYEENKHLLQQIFKDNNI